MQIILIIASLNFIAFLSFAAEFTTGLKILRVCSDIG